MFSAVAVGAMSVSLGASPAVMADTTYPSWDDVQNAKASEATKKVEIDRIMGILGGLQTAAEQASRSASIAAESYRVTQVALDAAIVREQSLLKQSHAADERARTSKMRAGLLAAGLAKGSAQDLSVSLLFAGDKSADLLQQLGTASQLSEQSEAIYRKAEQDKNTATSLGAQAAAATIERDELAVEAKAASDDATTTLTAAQSALAEQEAKADELIAQLALLKDTTAETEREYLEGLAIVPPPPPAPSPSPAPGNGGPGVVNPPPPPGGGSVTPPPPPPPPPPAGGGGPVAPPAPPPPPPVSSGVETAISFAYAQLGKPYYLGGSGPDRWDCSGLTMMSYRYAGMYIGEHTATGQYNTMAAQGRLVPFSQRQRGDLIFWGGGGGKYHVAIYLGNGRILEAPDWGKPVREYFIWSMGDVSAYVGRPG